jgi:siroheme synthase-like protein
MKTFPIMLGGANLRALVVGGGAVGLRKARALLAAGIDVTLVDPKYAEDTPRSSRRMMATAPGPKPAAAPKRGPRAGPSFRAIREPYRSSFVRGARLVLACTDDRQLNHRVAADARRSGALVNAADQPEDCDFYLPALIWDGDVVIAIGTGGSAPALAGSLKRTLAAALPPKVGRFAAEISRLRARLKKDIPDIRLRMAVLRKLSAPDVYEVYVSGGAKALRARARQLVREAGSGAR